MLVPKRGMKTSRKSVELEVVQEKEYVEPETSSKGTLSIGP